MRAEPLRTAYDLMVLGLLSTGPHLVGVDCGKEPRPVGEGA